MLWLTQHELLQLPDLRDFLYSLLRDAAVLCIEQTCTRPKSQQGLALGQLLVEVVTSVAVQECEGLQLRQGGQCPTYVVPLCRGAVLEGDGGCTLVSWSDSCDSDGLVGNDNRLLVAGVGDHGRSGVSGL